MLAGVAFSLSRGGLVALLATLGVFLAFGFLRYRRLSPWSAGLVSLAVGLGLLTWLGSARVHDRLATVWEGKAFRESRLPIWSRLLPLVGEFPVWGTGYGTIPYVESLHRNDAVNAEEICSHAENEYLEALVEGGGVRLALGLLAIGLVYRLGFRAAHSLGGMRRAGLAIGALFAFTTLVIHSLVDFGLHIPAIAFLATVVCAQLCALGGAERHAMVFTPPPSAFGLRSFLRFAAPAVAFVLAVALGAALCREGWRVCRVHWLRHDVTRLNPNPKPVSEDERLESLQEAALLAPQSARVQVELALIYYDRYREDRQKERNARLADQVGLDEEQIVRRHLVPALKHFLQARDLCPVLPGPHRYLANHAYQLGRAETLLAYLERVRLLVPHDAGIWYLCGGEVLDQDPERAWKCWRRALELSDDYLPFILGRARNVLGPREVMEAVIPDRPRLLLAAALQLYPESDAAARRPFLERALAALDRQPGPPEAKDLYLRAQLQVALSNPAAALQAYENALRRSPQEVAWRYEFARFLHSQGQFKEARRELVTLLRQQSDYAPARQLLEEVTGELAERD
jgi:hypothetical protein